jgi:colicin import membrane protein
VVAQANAAIAALEEAEREHDTASVAIERDRATLQQRADAEQERWEELKEHLKTAVRKASR